MPEGPLRDIEDILYFRTDVSPFLVHLTRSREDEDGPSAQDALGAILEQRKLVCGTKHVSAAQYGMSMKGVKFGQQHLLFSAICFTETPLSEIHCLLEIACRQVNLSPYGLVFLKKRLIEKGVSPVLYFNNKKGDKGPVFEALCSLHKTHKKQAEEILPLLSLFGEKIKSPDAEETSSGTVDFLWEREWRYPYASGDLEFTEEDVFIGLCPHGQREEFKKLFPVGFIDPRLNMKWYARELIEARERTGILFSVV